MNTEFPIGSEPATPEYILELLHEWYRVGALVEPPTFDTPVWSFAAQINDTIVLPRELARVLNDDLGLNVPAADWKAALARNKTLRDVCVFAADRMRVRPTIRPWNHVTGECLPAGAFLTARSLLAECGVNPDEITPGAALAPYLRGSVFPWLLTLTRAAPGRLPECTYLYRPRWVTVPAHLVLGPGSVGLLALGFVFLLMSIISAFGGLHGGNTLLLGIGGVVGLVSGIALLRWYERLTASIGIELASVRTFRDLAYTVTGQEPRRRIQPSP